MEIDHIYILNVPTEIKRKEHMKNMLISENLKEGTNFTILQGVDGRKITKEQTDVYNKQRLIYYSKNNLETKKLTRGQIGCIKSHLLAYEHMLLNNYKCCLILEDDAKFTKSFKEICTILKQFPSNYEVDYILLHRKCPNLCLKARTWPFVKNWFISPNNDVKIDSNLFIKAGLSYGTNSQIVTNTGACKLLKFCETIYDPMDIQIHMMNHHTNIFQQHFDPLEVYATLEPLTEPAGFGSLTQRIR